MPDKRINLKQNNIFSSSALHYFKSSGILSKYVSLADDVILHKLPIGGLVCKRSSGKFNKPICYSVNKTAMKLFEIVSRERCMTVQDVILRLFEEFQEKPTKDMITSIIDFIKEAVSLGHLVLLDEPEELCISPRNPRVTGSEVITIPMEIVIELTYRCNLRCVHCYAEASIEREETMPMEKVCHILNTFSSLGTRLVEFTGGEPLMHPNISDILVKALNLFDLVSIITNGTLITDEIIDIARRYKDKILFSITIYSHRPEIHDSITGVKGSFYRTVENLKRLINEGVLVRASVVITHINAGDLYKTVEFLYNMGVKTITYSPAYPIGRGVDIEQYLSSIDFEILGRQLNDIMRDFRDRLQILPEEVLMFVLEHGCGTGWRTLIIDPTGNVKLCIFGGPVLGNIFQQGVYEVLRRASRLYSMPPPSEKVCGKCEYLSFCKGCYFRPYIVSRRLGRKCPYVEKLEKMLGGF